LINTKRRLKKSVHQRPEEASLAEPNLQNSGAKRQTSANNQDELKYSMQYKDYQNKEFSQRSLNKTFAIIHGRMSRHESQKRTTQLGNHRQNCDPIGLLKIIKVAHNNESQKPNSVPYPCRTTPYEHDTSRWTINEAYRLKFENQANVIENMGGQLYRDSTLNIVSKQK
jgi:hypothetical protein